ncbi:MAG TPA: prepilin peptidase [Epulopiscium sp.]|nr:prepilin peptidase [Candidatus Epulonipiscium sp.]
MIEYVMVAVLGAIIGSFLNVCIYRIPKKESLNYPGSHCTSCKHNLRPLDLIPILSYVALRGRCRYCGAKISIQYPFIEMINGVLYILIYHYFGIGLTSAALGVLFSTLLTVAVIDYYTMRIPNSLIVFGTSVGIIYLMLQALYMKERIIIVQGIVGFIVGGGMIGLIIIFSLLVFKKDGMGMGDLKLLAMIGLFTGSKHAFFTIFIAVIVGSFYGILILRRKKQELFPFGPFLSVGAVIGTLWGDVIWTIYMNCMH